MNLIKIERKTERDSTQRAGEETRRERAKSQHEIEKASNEWPHCNPFYRLCGLFAFLFLSLSPSLYLLHDAIKFGH